MFFTALLLLSSLYCSAQSFDVDLKKEKIYDYADQMPAFNGDIYTYLQKHLDIPASCGDTIGSKLSIKFVVDRNGKVRNPVVVRGWCKSLDKKVQELFGSMPAWKPGMRKGKAVNVLYTMPIIVDLD